MIYIWFFIIIFISSFVSLCYSIYLLLSVYIKSIWCVLKIIKFMDENDPFSEYNKIPFGHNRTNGAVYSNMNFEVEICSAL